MKKLAITITCLALLLLLIFSVSAASGSDFSDAISINTNQTYSGNISDEDDMDFYKFSLPSPGKVNLFFSHKNLFDDSEYWVATIYDSKAHYVSNYSLRGTDTSITSYSIGLDAGTYYFRVVGGDYSVYSECSYCYDTTTYSFAINYTASNFWEEENSNESFEDAKSIVLNKSYSGSIFQNTDVDFFKFTLSSPGQINISFSHKNLFDDSEYWFATIFDSKTHYVSKYSLRGTDTSITSYSIGLDAGTYYFRVVGGDYSSYSECSYCFNNCTYSFTINYIASNFWEEENNNESFENAKSIVLNNNYFGSIFQDTDVDFFKITIKTPSTFKFSLSHNNLKTEEEYWVVNLYNAATKSLSNISVPGNDTGSATVALSEGTYYIRITGGDYSNYSEQSYCYNRSIYTLRIEESVEVATPSALKVSTRSTTSLMLSWNAVSGAKGYVVYSYNINTGKYKKLAATSTNSFTVNGLKAGTIHRYAVRAYKTANKKNYYSEYSAVLTTATKPNAPQVTIMAGTKSASLSWNKVAGAKSYVIYWSTKKSSGFKKLGITKNTYASVSNLVSGKTYYFKVRAYRKAGGVNIYSDYSAVKGITAK